MMFNSTELIESLFVSIKLDNLVDVETLVTLYDVMLEEKYNGYTPLQFASAYGRIKIVEFFLDHIEDDDESFRNASIALHEAVKYNHFTMVRFLLIYGADPNTRDIYGQSPLQVAFESGHLGIIQYLIRFDAVL